MATNKLKDIQPKQAKAGGKCWRMDYRFADKRKTLALGPYPDVSLEQARKARDQARENLKSCLRSQR